MLLTEGKFWKYTSYGKHKDKGPLKYSGALYPSEQQNSLRIRLYCCKTESLELALILFVFTHAFFIRFDPTISSAWVNREEIAGNLKSIKVTARDMPRNAIEYLKISGENIVYVNAYHVMFEQWT